MEPSIVVRDGNPWVAGTRTTVYSIYHYLEGGWRAEEIAEALELSSEQVRAAVQYIEDHKEDVLAVHRQIEERIARGNPPEVEARREATRARMQEWLHEGRQTNGLAGSHEGDSGGH